MTGHQFGAKALEGLLSSDAYLEGRLACSAVFSLPGGRSGHTVGYADVGDLARAHDVPLFVAGEGSLVSEIERLSDLRPHYILVIGWSRLVHGDVLDIPANLWGTSGAVRNSEGYGCIGMHPTRLPEGRGQAPIPWSIIFGLRETALSTFFLEDTADSGNLIRQLPLAVRAHETASSLFMRFADLHFHSGELLAAEMAARRVVSRPQGGGESVWPRRRPADSTISLDCSASELDAFIRALRWPYPSAYLTIEGLPFLVARCEVVGPNTDGRKGVVEAAEHSVSAYTNDHLVTLHGRFEKATGV